MAAAALLGVVAVPQAAWADSVTANNPGISGATELTNGELDGAIVRFVPTNWDYELNFHNDSNTNGCDLYTYYLGTSSKMQLHWDSGKQAYYIDFYIRFDESEKRGKVWDVDGQSTKDGAQVHAWSPGWDNDSMYWRFWQNADGTYYIQNKHSGGYVALENLTANESDVRAKMYNSTKMTFDVEVIYDSDGGAYQYGTYSDALDWMKYLDDDAKLSTVSIPGTHDSGTNGADETHSQANLYECQKYFIDEQLNVGVRAFDIRLDGDDIGDDGDNPDPRVVHTAGMRDRDGTDLRLSDVMGYFKTYLDEHPSETLIMMVKCNEGSDSNIQKAMERYIGEDDSVIWTGEGVPTVGEARGKIVTIRRYTLDSTTKYDSDKDYDPFKWHYGFDATQWDWNNYGLVARPELVAYSWPDDPDETENIFYQIFAQDYYNATSSEKVDWVESSWDDMVSDDSPNFYYGYHSLQDADGVETAWYESWVFNYTSTAQGEPATAPMDHARNVNLPLIEDGYADNSGKATWRGITMFDYIDGSWSRAIIQSNFDGGEVPDHSFPSTVTTTYGDDLDDVTFSDDGSTGGNGRYFTLSENAKAHDGYYEVSDSGTSVEVNLCDSNGTVIATGHSTLQVEPRPANMGVGGTTIEYGDEPIANEENTIDYFFIGDTVCSDGTTVPDITYTMTSATGGDANANDGRSYRVADVYNLVVDFADTEHNKNYDFSAYRPSTQLYIVNQKPVEINWDNVSDEYPYSGAGVSIDHPTIDNVVQGDECVVVLEGDTATEQGTYTATVVGLEGADATNYTLDGVSNTTFSYTVTAALPYSMVTVTCTPFAYGQTLGEAYVSVTAFDADMHWVPGTFTFDDPSIVPQVSDSGKQYEGTFTPDDKNYEPCKASTTVNVNKRFVTIQLNSATSTYGDSQPAALSEYAEVPTEGNTGLVEGDDLKLTLSIEDAVGDVGSGENAYNKTSVGEHAVTATSSNGNYQVTVQKGTWTVEPRVAELTWENVTNRHVGDDVGDPAATVGNALPGDDVTVDVSAPVLERAGDVDGTGLYKVTAASLSGKQAGNYTLGNDTERRYYVRKAESDCAFPTFARFTYGGTLAEVQDAQTYEGGSGDGTFKFIGDVKVTKTADADGVSISDGKVVEGATLATVLDAGTYTVEGTMVFTPRDGSTSIEVQSEERITVSVDQRPIAVSAQNAEKEYGDEMPTLEAKVTSGALVNGDSLDEIVSISAKGVSADEDKVNLTPVGSYDIVVSAEDADKGNYDVTCVDGTLSVYQCTLEFAWSGMDDLVYDGNAKSVEAKPTNVLSDDDVTITVVGGDAVDAGTHYAIVTAIEGDDAGNYRLPSASTVGSNTSRVQEYTIDKATPVVTWPKGSLSYGQALSDTVFSGGSATGVQIEGEAEEVAGTFAFADDVDASKKPDVDDSGTYKVTFTPSSSNYESVTGDAMVTVAAKSVSVYIHDASSTFGDALPELKCTILGGTNEDGTPKGLVDGDTVDDLGLSLSVEGAEGDFDYDGVTYNRTAAGTYDIVGTATGEKAKDYVVTFIGYSRVDDDSVQKNDHGTFTVSQREVELTWSGTVNEDGSELVYDGNAKNVTASASGTVPRSAAGGFDELGVTVEGGAETNAGSHTATAIALTGDTAANYRLPDDATTTYNIAQATPTITVVPTATLTYGESLADATVDAAGRATGVDGAPIAGAFAFTGSSATVHPSVGNSIGASDATTYQITFTPTDSNYTTATAQAGVTVAKRVVNVYIDDAQSTYGDPLPEFTFEVDDDALVLGDTADDLAVTLSVEGGSADFERDGVIYNNTPVGTYQIAGTSESLNYDVNFGGVRLGEGELGIAYIAQTGRLTVSRRVVELEWSGLTNRYLDDGLGDPVATVVNLVPKPASGVDDVTVTTSKQLVTKPDGAAEGVGLYTIEATGLAGIDASNYKLVDSSLKHYYVRKDAADCAFPSYAEFAYGGTVGEADYERGSGDGDFAFDETKPYTVVRTADAEGNAVNESIDGATLDTVLDAGTYTVAGTMKFTPNDPSSMRSATSEVTLEVVVSKRHVTVAIADATKTYGDAMPAFEATIAEGELVGEDSLNLSFVGEDADGNQTSDDYVVDGTTYNVTPVGDYAMQAVSNNANYDVSSITSTLTVEPLEVEFTWNNVTNRYLDDDLGAPTATVTNVVPRADGGSDDVSVIAGEPELLTKPDGAADGVGLFRIAADHLDGEDASNYVLTDTNERRYYVRKDAADCVFPSYAQAVYGDTLGVVLTDNDALEGSSGDGTFAFDLSKGLTITDAAGNEVDATQDTVLDAGTYKVTGWIVFTPNDTSTTRRDPEKTTIELVVSKRSITVSALDAEKVYGDAMPAFKAEVTEGELVSGDSLDYEYVVRGSNGGKAPADFECDGKMYNVAAAGTYTIRPQANDSNYDIAVETGTLTVSPREVTLAWSGVTNDDGSTLVYDGEAQGVAATAGNLVPTSSAGDLDVVNVTVDGGDALHAGSYTATAVGLTDEDGDEASNYCLPKEASIDYAIAKAKPQVTWPKGGVVAVGDTLSSALFDEVGSAAGVDGEALAGTFAFADPSQVIDQAGTESYAMTFTPDAIDGYEDYESVEGSVAVTASAEVDPGSGIGPNDGNQNGESAGSGDASVAPDTSDSLGWVVAVCACIAVCAAAVVAVCIARAVHRTRR